MMGKKSQVIFVCQECGHESPKWMGQCICGKWNTMVEEKVPDSGGPAGRQHPGARDRAKAVRIGDVGISAIPFEVFSEIGLELKARNPFQPSFTIELANGGYGYLRDYPIERFWRDLRVHSILEGTNQVMRMIVGRELTRQ